MAVAIAEYQHVVYTRAAPGGSDSTTLPSMTWSTGDVFVLIYGCEDTNGGGAGTIAPATPSVSGLTFTAVSGSDLFAANNCRGKAYTAAAASGGSGTISVGFTAILGTYHWGVSCWRLTGASATLGVVGGLQSASGSTLAARTVTISPVAGSTVVWALFDWGAGAAGKTGVPTVTTEREDLQQGSNYSVWVGDAVSVAGGSTAFGISAGTVTATKIAIEVKDGGGGPSPITGTGATTLGAITSAGTGTYTPPPVTGTGATTLGAITSAGTGNHTAPGAITGTGATTLGAITSAGSGTYTAPNFTGTGATTLGAIISTSTGVYTPPPVTGTGARTLGPIISAGAGTHTAPSPISGTGATTLGAITSAGTGVHTAAAPAGTGATVLRPITSVGVGLHALAAAGTGATVLGRIVSVGVGTMAAHVITFTCPTVDERADLDQWRDRRKYPLARRIVMQRGINLFLLDTGAVTTQQPFNNQGLVKIYHGGHIIPITQAEADVLTAAGYGGGIST